MRETERERDRDRETETERERQRQRDRDRGPRNGNRPAQREKVILNGNNLREGIPHGRATSW